MSSPRNIAVIVGSLRKESFSRKLAQALIEMQPAPLRLEFLEIGQLVHYNQDLETDTPPAPWVEFRQRLKATDGVMFVTPEYNRSMPGVLKNALDVGSRPPRKSSWDGKPAAVISVSPGALGGFGANHHLRQALVFLNMPTLQKEAYVGQAKDLFDAEGKLTRSDTREFLAGVLKAYADWVELLSRR